MTEINVDVSMLPEDIREKLAELDLELSEGEPTTRVGYNCILLDTMLDGSLGQNYN